MPYWPFKTCELSKPDGFQVKDGSTELIELMKQESSSNETDPNARKRGYGHVPLKNLLDKNSNYLHDNATGEEYEHDCNYQGAMMNLYNNGTIHEFNDLFLELYPEIYNSSIPHRDRAKIIESFAQDEN